MDFLPGEPTSALQALCFTKWNHHSIFTYASGNNLIILTGLMKNLQTVYFQNDLICIDINSITGDIAVCDSQNTLFIYSSSKDNDFYSDTQQYRFLGSIHFGDKYSIKGICWGNEKEIIIGTQNTILLYYNSRPPSSASKFSLKLIWQFPIGIPCYLIKFSQNSELIALIGKNDKLLKIFYRSNFDPDNTKFQLILLKQNSIITDFKFRFIDLNKDYSKKNDDHSIISSMSTTSSSNYNILYTVNEDNYVKVFLSFEFEKSKKIQHWGSLKLNNSSLSVYRKNKTDESINENNEDSNLKYIKFIDNYFLKYLILRSSDRLQRSDPQISKSLLDNLDKLLSLESDMILVFDKNKNIGFYLVTNLNAKPPKEINFLKLQFNDSILNNNEQDGSYNNIFFKLPDGILPSNTSDFTLFSDNLKVYNKKFFQQKFLEDNHNKITFGNVNEFKNKSSEISNKGDLCFLLHNLTEKIIKVIYIRFDNVFKFINYESLFKNQFPEHTDIILSSRRKSSVTSTSLNSNSMNIVPTKTIASPTINHNLSIDSLNSLKKKFLQLNAVLDKNITGHTKSVQRLVSNRYDNVLLSFSRFNEHKMWSYKEGILSLKCIVDYDLEYGMIIQTSNSILGYNKSLTKLVLLNCESLHSKIIKEFDLKFLKRIICFFKVSVEEFDYVTLIYENNCDKFLTKCWKIDSKDISINELKVDVPETILNDFKTISCLSINDNSSRDIENGDILSTITNDGIMRCYSVNINKDIMSLSVTNTIFTSISNADYIKGSSIKKVAVVNGEKKKLFIYNTNYGMLEYTYSFDQPVNDIDWACINYKIERTNRNNPSLLSVGFESNVILFSQLNFDYTNDMPAFAPIKNLEFAQTSHNISDSVWLNGILFVGSGNQIIFYDCTAKNSLSWTDIKRDQYTQKIIGDRSLSSNKITSILHLVELLNNSSPLYHPQVLIQCIYWGKIHAAKIIILKLYLYLKQVTPEEDDIATDDEDDESISNKDGFKKFKAMDLPATLGLDITEFYKENAPLDDLSGEDEDSLYSTKNFCTWAVHLKDLLTRISLPVLTRHQQITLLTVIESLELIDNNKEVLSMTNNKPDICSVNFLLGFKLFQSHYKMQLSLNMRDNIFALHSQKQKVLLDILTNSIGDTSEFYWSKVKAYGMVCWLENDLLVNQFEKIANNEFQNSSFPLKNAGIRSGRQYSCPFYYEKSPAKNPINSMIFYLALRKKQIIISLWKISHGHPDKEKMVKFLSNDFTQEKYKVVALKNAFSLLSKHRFLLSACFFLLAGKLHDCCRVLIKQCNDIDLAMGVARVYQLSNKMRSLEKVNHFHNILIDNLLPVVLQDGNRWLNSYIYYSIQEPKLLMLSLIETPYNVLRIASENKEFLKNQDFRAKLEAVMKDFGGNSDDKIEGNNFVENDPILAVLYKELRSKLSTRHNTLGINETELVEFANKFDKQEFTFVLRVALIYSRMGCDVLSLPVMRNWKFSGIYFKDIIERVRQTQLSTAKNENGSTVSSEDISNRSQEANRFNLSFNQELKPTNNTVEEFNFDNFGF